MERADPPGLRAGRALGENRVAAALAVGAVAAGEAAEGALTLAEAPERNPLLEVALERDERDQGQADADRGENERAELERVDVVGHVVARHDEGEDRREADGRQAQRQVARACLAEPAEERVGARQRGDDEQEPGGEAPDRLERGGPVLLGLDLARTPPRPPEWRRRPLFRASTTATCVCSYTGLGVLVGAFRSAAGASASRAVL